MFNCDLIPRNSHIHVTRVMDLCKDLRELSGYSNWSIYFIDISFVRYKPILSWHILSFSSTNLRQDLFMYNKTDGQ